MAEAHDRIISAIQDYWPRHDCSEAKARTVYSSMQQYGVDTICAAIRAYGAQEPDSTKPNWKRVKEIAERVVNHAHLIHDGADAIRIEWTRAGRQADDVARDEVVSELLQADMQRPCGFTLRDWWHALGEYDSYRFYWHTDRWGKRMPAVKIMRLTALARAWEHLPTVGHQTEMRKGEILNWIQDEQARLSADDGDD